MNEKGLRFIACHHAAGRPHRPCPPDARSEPCDADLLATEVSRQRAWADFASDLLDAHIWGFSAGDWQAAEALAHALEGSDWPPDWRRDPDDAAHIIVDAATWPATTPDIPRQQASVAAPSTSPFADLLARAETPR